MIIRTAVPEDAEQLLEIYAPYVEKTAITFEYNVPNTEEFGQRIANTLAKYPYLVAEIDGEAVGYAYAGALKGRAAYDWAVEMSVYVKKNMRKLGIGKALYTQLEDALKKQNIHNLYACITSPIVEDKYLTKNSVFFHESMGYRQVAEFHKCGYKFDTWYNVVWMEKIIAPHLLSPGKFIPFRNMRFRTVIV